MKIDVGKRSLVKISWSGVGFIHESQSGEIESVKGVRRWKKFWRVLCKQALLGGFSLVWSLIGEQDPALIPSPIAALLGGRVSAT